MTFLIFDTKCSTQKFLKCPATVFSLKNLHHDQHLLLANSNVKHSVDLVDESHLSIGWHYETMVLRHYYVFVSQNQSWSDFKF